MSRRLLPQGLAGLLLLVAGCSDAPTELALPSVEPSTRSWVTTDRAAAEALQTEFPNLGASFHEQPSGLLAFELERAQLPAVSEVLHQKLSRCPGFMLEDSFEAASAEPPPPPGVPALQVAYVIDNAATVAALLAPLNESTLRDTIQQRLRKPARS